MTKQKITISNIIQNYFKSVGCATCQGNIEKHNCKYCTPVEHNNMYHVSKTYADEIAEEILKII